MLVVYGRGGEGSGLLISPTVHMGGVFFWNFCYQK